MQSFAKVATRSACRLRPQRQLQQRRWASDASHEPQTHSTPAPRDESFGAGFFVSLLLIPAAIAVYSVSRPGQNGEQPYFSKLITRIYEDYATKNSERNALHTDAVEQAAADRSLFLDNKRTGARHVELRFPEMASGGSPLNVPAGHGSANIDALIAKYQQEAFESNEKKHQQLRDNKVPVEQPLVVTMPKVTPGSFGS